MTEPRDWWEAMDQRQERERAPRCSATFPCEACVRRLATELWPIMAGVRISWCEARRISADGP